MNNEVKEIFDRLRYAIVTHSALDMSLSDYALICDYIIHLRKENEIINKQYKEYIKELRDSLRNCHIKNNKLINKNERLKEENKMTDEQIEKTLEVVSEHIYKSRIDKANNKLQTMFDNGNEQLILDDLLELDRILNGGYE